MENFEQLKRNMMWAFENRPDIPLEILQLIQKMFLELEEKYKSMRCDSSTIKEYMHGNIEQLIARLEGEIGKKRKDEQFDDILGVLSGVERDIEEKLDEEEQKEKDNQRQYQINEIGNNGNNVRRTINTIYLVEEYLRDVQSRQNRILYARGMLNDKQIKEIDDEVRHFIGQLRNKNEQGIHDAYKEDSIELRKQLLEIYQSYVMGREHEEQNENGQQNHFKDSLSAGIALEEQKAFLEERIENSRENEQYEQKSSSLEDLFK